jgi:membrane fusion protein
MPTSAASFGERVCESQNDVEKDVVGGGPRTMLPAIERQVQVAPSSSLFRPEVMVEHQSQWLGAVLLEPRITDQMFAFLALLATAALLGLLFFASYTRKAHISGWLVPQQGLVRIFAPHAGVITQIQVREGMRVSKGAPLLGVSTELRSEALGATHQEIVIRLRKRRNSLLDEKAVQERLFAQQRAELTQQITALHDEQNFLEQEKELQRSRIQLSEKVAGRTRAMRARDIVPEPRLEDAERERIEQTAKLQNLQRTQASLQHGLLQLEGSLRELPLKRTTVLAEIDRNVAALEQELAEAESRREIIIEAPQDGIVTGLQIETGGSTQPNVPLMNIVPEGAILQAQLFSSSSAVGFVHEGQRVLLRYAAFPYQKFGLHEGVVVSVSRAAISPSEMPQQLSGLSTLYGANEPVYRISVDLKSQTVMAYGNPMPLQPGMQLEADVLLESRRLVEWALEPLFTLSGKWTG